MSLNRNALTLSASSSLFFSTAKHNTNPASSLRRAGTEGEGNQSTVEIKRAKCGEIEGEKEKTKKKKKGMLREAGSSSGC